MIRGKKILITGASGQIAFPLSMRLAEHNEVWGIARFSEASRREELERRGVRTETVDIVDPDYSALPKDFDHVVHLVAYMGGDGDSDKGIEINALGTGRLLSHFREAGSTLVMSTTGVYHPSSDPWYKYRETDRLGDATNTRVPSYGVTKVAQEAVARFCAIEFNMPVVIARMNASYGPYGGLPARQLDLIMADQPVSVRSDPAPYSPIHDADIADHLEGILRAASAPAEIVNFGGDEVVTAQEWCAYFGELSGKEPRVEVNPVPGSQPGIALDVSKRRSLTGPDKIHWRDGMREMYEARYGQARV